VENDSIYVTASVDGPTTQGKFSTAKVLRASVDIDKDGVIDRDKGEEVFFEFDRPSGNTLVAQFTFPDDGEWLGNGTRKDEYKIELEFVNDRETETITVENVPPKIASSVPTVKGGVDELGRRYTDVSIARSDPGLKDQHRLSIELENGDRLVGQWHDNHEGCNGSLLTQRFYVAAVPLPYTLILEDDDLGVDERKINLFQVLLNNDDDDSNDRQDLFDSGFSDDDLVDVGDLTSPEMSGLDGSYRVHYDPTKILVWDSPTKDNLIVPASGYDRMEGIAFTGEQSLWVEGIAPSNSLLYVTFTPDASGGPNNCNNTLIGDLAAIQVLGIDVDIDSDNTNGLALPARDWWEEELEDNEYGIGKMLLTQSNDYTPFVISLPPNLDPDSQSIRLHFEDIEHNVSSGDVKIYKKLPTGRFDEIPFGLRTLREVGYANGEVVLYLKASAYTAYNQTLIDVESYQKTDDRLKVSIVGNGVVKSDTVKWMVVERHSFYPTLQATRALRNAGASEKIYDLVDNKNFTMKYLSEEEVLDLIEDDFENLANGEENLKYIMGKLFPKPFDPDNPTDPAPGFKAGIYRDHAGGPLDYIIAFAGTEIHNLDDAIANLDNFFHNGAIQHHSAMATTYLLHKYVSELGGLQATGHSLGGGLASVAALAASIHADTFNAAGVPEHTLIDSVTGNPLYPEILIRFKDNYAYIDAYRVWTKPNRNGTHDSPDVLSWFQHHMGLAPEALGNPQDLEGLKNLSRFQFSALESASAALESSTNGDTIGEILRAWISTLGKYFFFPEDEIIESHSLPSIYFGFLHDDGGWNAFDHARHDP
jgi:hypothetical protein